MHMKVLHVTNNNKLCYPSESTFVFPTEEGWFLSFPPFFPPLIKV